MQLPKHRVYADFATIFAYFGSPRAAASCPKRHCGHKKGPFRIFPKGSFLAGADADGQDAVAEADGRKLSFFSYTLYYIMWRVAASRCPDGRADGWGGLR